MNKNKSKYPYTNEYLDDDFYDDFDADDFTIECSDTDDFSEDEIARINKNIETNAKILFIAAWIFFFPIMLCWYVYEYIKTK